MLKRLRKILFCAVVLTASVSISAYFYMKFARARKEKLQGERWLTDKFDNLHKCTNDPKHKVWLVSYAEGDVYKANQNWQTFSAINKCIDFYLPYRFKDLDAEFVTKNKELLSKTRGAGYWVWKPYVILKTLKMIPEGDIVYNGPHNLDRKKEKRSYNFL